LSGLHAWHHDKGQVEIDAVMFARRGGRRTLFVVEAKKGKRANSLAKHKLVYPALALSGHPAIRSFESDVDIVPVYLRAWSEGDQIHYQITECVCSGLQEGHTYISELSALRTRILSMSYNIS